MRHFTLILIAMASLTTAAYTKPVPLAPVITDPFAKSARDAWSASGPGGPSQQQFARLAGDTVTFDIDDARLSPQAHAVLIRQAQWLSRNIGWSALIQGHADENGTREYNLSLDARRAGSVRDYLVARGVDAARIRTVSFGKERPYAHCTTETCKVKNRRAVTIVSPAEIG